MSAATAWLDGNNEYLAASLHWLRLRLRRLVPPKPAMTMKPESPAAPDPAAEEVAAEEPAAPAKRSWFSRSTRPPAPAAAVPTATPHAVPHAAGLLALPAGDAAAIFDTALAEAAAHREAAAAIHPPPALLLIAERLGLSAFERDTLLLCASAELDPATESLFAVVQGGPARAFPTFSLALRVLDDPTWDALSPHRPLRYARLLEISQPGPTPLTAAALRADERIVNFLKGMNMLDERVAALVTPVAEDHRAKEDGPGLAPSQREAVDALLEQLRRSAGESALPIVHLLGADPGAKLALAREICAQLDRRLYRLDLESLPTARGEIENLGRLWQRETALLPVALYVDAENLESAPAELASALHGLTAQDIGLVFVASRAAPARAATTRRYTLEVEKPTPIEQRDAWIAALHASGEEPEGLAEAEATAQLLAGQFHLNIHEIRDAAEQARRQARAAAPLAERLWDACRNLTQPRLDALAQRLVPKATWNDLVLPAESAALLQQIAAQVRERFRVYEDWGYARRMTRGLGISALFTGESGVGKTMAAEVIANELRLHLYRIDLSAVVSKYIGETEKNLRRLFDAAEQGGAILFFDEADALFGKRSEVKDSHDRYANIEINYLLQRMEAFSGLAILASNMKSALDLAFMRRLRFIVHFPFPGLAERKRIWQQALPPEVPRDELDYDRLARFTLSGGNIHSVALNAAFLAAQRATPVTVPLIMAAVRSELRKLEKPINEAEFR
ncbi:MAG TPA: ATP-binding protein [Kofleriaceae bacterium]|nr:ATP-binding protein [Kofleriaceae bacterium]